MFTDEGERSHYYQEIARAFFERRGAPFFLSAKEIDLVASWEAARIPLPVVLEGIEKTFSDRSRIRAPKKLSLAFCGNEVRRAFERHRDRRVGSRRAPARRDDKRLRLRAELDRFLAAMPAELLFLRNIFAEAGEALASATAADEALERMDGRAETLLLANAAADDRDAARRAVLAEHRRIPPGELAAAVDTRLLKLLREKYRIPYLSLFYY